MGPNSRLKFAFAKYNRQYFHGKLKISGICYGKMKDVSGETTFFDRCYPTITIEIGLKNFPRLSRLILLHEMVHVSLPISVGHGPRFERGIRRLIRLGAYKGLL
jgi:hypothetical protein